MKLGALKHYQVLRPLGRGGMGEVYLALDTTLGRQVAIKVLPEDLAAHQDDLDRFAQEARTVAALNHPNIVTIYSVEEAEGIRFLTMELVDGKTLAELIPRRGFPIGDLLKIGIPLADAVSAAHEKGVVHRDLKPANVMLRENGQVKVLDFGLAKLTEAASAAAPDSTTQPVSGDGRIVGTVSYMSPEQAAGKTLDGRSDVFSLGVVLYEMATGERPFKGDSSVAIMSAILRDTAVPVTDLNAAAPPLLARIIRICLQKDPERRFQSAKDVRNELHELKTDLDSGTLSAPAVAAAAQPRRRALILGLIAVGALAIAGSLIFSSWRRSESRATGAIAAFNSQLTTTTGPEADPSLSPDGKWIVYSSLASGNRDIYLQAVGGQTAINLTKDSPTADGEPAFAANGEQIAFRSERDGGGIFVMGRTGESPTRLTNFGHDPSWSPDGGAIVFASRTAIDPTAGPGASELWTVDTQTRETRRLLERDGLHPQWSHTGRLVAYWGLETTGGHRNIWMIPVGGGKPVPITNDAALDWRPAWAPDDRLLYFLSDRGGNMGVWRVAIDPDTGQRVSDPESVQTSGTFAAGLSISADGRRVVYASIARQANSYRVEFDPAKGRIIGAPIAVTDGSRPYVYHDISPDGQWVALSSFGVEDLWVCRIDGRELRNITADAHYDRSPRWANDSRQIAYFSNRSGKYEIWSIDRDGGNRRQLTQAADNQPVRPVWSPDNTRLLFTDFARQTVTIFDPRQGWSSQTPEVLPAIPNQPTRFFIPTSWSADGRHIAGYFNETQGIVVYNLTSRVYERVSETGTYAAYLRDGRLLTNGAQKLLLVDPATRQSSEVYAVAAPETIAAVSVSADNRTVVFLKRSMDADIWMAELSAR